nr:MAG TPA: hypothetical protein [Caudoviricetes sp.]
MRVQFTHVFCAVDKVAQVCSGIVVFYFNAARQFARRAEYDGFCILPSKGRIFWLCPDNGFFTANGGSDFNPSVNSRRFDADRQDISWRRGEKKLAGNPYFFKQGLDVVCRVRGRTFVVSAGIGMDICGHSVLPLTACGDIAAFLLLWRHCSRLRDKRKRHYITKS